MKSVLCFFVSLLFLSGPCFAGQEEASISREERAALYEAQQAYLAEDYDAAGRILDDYLKKHSRQTPSHKFFQIRGTVCYLKGDLKGANRAFKAGVRIEPGDDSLCINYARSCYELSLFGEAALYFEKGYRLKVEQGEKKGALLFQAGLCHYSDKAYLKAELVLKELISQGRPCEKNWVNLLMHALLEQEKTHEAEAWLTRHLEKNPDEREYWKLLSSLRLDLKKYCGAACALSVFATMGDCDISVLKQLADLYRYVDAPLKAASVYERIAKKEPDSKTLDRIAELYLAGGYDQKAQAFLIRAAETDPSPRRCFMLGKFYFDGRRYQDAVAAFDRALAMDAGNADSVIYKGHALMEAGDWKGAKQILTAALGLKEIRDAAVSNLRIVDEMLAESRQASGAL